MAPNRADEMADGFPCEPKTDWDMAENDDGAEISPPTTPNPEVAPVAPGAGIPNNPVEALLSFFCDFLSLKRFEPPIFPNISETKLIQLKCECCLDHPVLKSKSH